MISALLSFKNQKNSLGPIELDCTISEVHNRDNTVTAFPLEDGRTASDHVIKRPKTARITGVITNSPLSWIGNVGDDSARAQNAFDILEGLYESRELFDVFTSHKHYKNCVFKSLEMPKSRAGELRITATIQELEFVTPELGSIPSSQLAPQDRHLSDSVNVGQVQGREVDESTAQSILSGIFGGE